MSGEYAHALQRLSGVPGVHGALVVETTAGVPVASEMTAEVDGRALAALAASLYRRAADAAEAGGFARARTLQLESNGGEVFVAEAGELLVVAVATRDAQLGRVRLEARRAAESLT